MVTTKEFQDQCVTVATNLAEKIKIILVELKNLFNYSLKFIIYIIYKIYKHFKIIIKFFSNKSSYSNIIAILFFLIVFFAPIKTL